MRHVFYAAALLLFVCATQTLGQGFHSVHSPNGVDVWAVGNGGAVFHSFDGGVTWGSYPIGSTALRGVFTFGTHVWIVGDGGEFDHSTDGGTSWNSTLLGGGENLRAIVFVGPSNGWVAGDNGTILRTTDGGASWTAQASTTTNHLRGLSFTDSLTGYAAGVQGTLLKTTNGGFQWAGAGGSGWSRDLTSVAAMGSTVYVTCTDGLAYKSSNGGLDWSALNLGTDSQSDVLDVFIHGSGGAFFVGGGGYIRETSDGGATLSWARHPLHASLNDIFFYDTLRGWACTQKNNAILRTSDGGSTWSLPQGTTVSYSWSQRLSVSATVRGNAFSLTPLNKDAVFVALGRNVYASYNRGETWAVTATMPGSISGSKFNSFYVSPKDSNLWVGAFGSPDGIVRTTDHGATWVTTISRAFTEYGMPLEMDGSHPDTLVFGPEDGYFYRSTDFGDTWDTVSRPLFRSPCDFVIVRDSADIIWCGDGITGSGLGQMFRSKDGGKNWTLIYTNPSGSEIPTVAGGSLANSTGFATAWGSDGVRKTTNYGESWTQIATTGSAWGVDIARDDPNVVMYGVYGGGTSYLSTNGGTTFSTSSLSGSNYAFLCYDRSTFLAQQSGGVWKYNITYTVPTSNVQTLAVVSPNGGENWQYNTTHNIVWTAGNISNVKIDYKTDPGSAWQTIVSSTPASAGSYPWIVPNSPASQARVRVSDASDMNPVDSSNAFFAITVAGIAVQPSSLGFGVVPIGSTVSDTVRLFNAGTATLVVSAVSTNGPNFAVGRTSFSIPPSSSDTLSVTFVPTAVQTYHDTLRFTCNAPAGVEVALLGVGTNPLSVQHEEIPVNYFLSQNYPNPFNPSTTISYGLPKEGHVSLKMYNMLGQDVVTLVEGFQPAGTHSVQFSVAGENTPDLSSGIYFYRLRVGDYVEMKKLLILK